MRIVQMLSGAALVLALAASSRAEPTTEVPITEDVVEVFSGPGPDFYRTAILYKARSDRVKILQEGPEVATGWVAIAPPAGSQHHHYRAYLQSGRPLVFIERTVVGVKTDYVGVDGRAGGFAAASHLLRLGRRRLGVLSLPLDVSASIERLDGIRDALLAEHLTLSSGQVEVGHFSEREGFAAAQRLIENEPRTDALIAAGLRMTIGAFAAVREAGLRIPEDIALIGYDETPWASLLTPPLTVVRQPARDLGRIAAEIDAKWASVLGTEERIDGPSFSHQFW